MVNPNNIQLKKTSQLLAGISIIKYEQHKTPQIGINDNFLRKLYTANTTAKATKSKKSIS